jgi:hypothetical protein
MNISVNFPELTVQVVAEHTDSVKDLKSKMSYFSESDELLTFNGCLLTNDEDQLSTLGVADGSVMSVINKNNKSVSFRKPSVASNAIVSQNSFIANIGSFFASIMPNLIISSGILVAAGMISAGLVVGATILSERKQEMFSKDELKALTKEITDGAVADLVKDNYAGLKDALKEVLQHVYIGGQRVYRLVGW